MQRAPSRTWIMDDKTLSALRRRNEKRLEAAKARLGEHYICHPSRRSPRITPMGAGQ